MMDYLGAAARAPSRVPFTVRDRGGKDVSEFPEDLRVQEMPLTPGATGAKDAP